MEPAIDLDHLEAATFGDRALQREVLELFSTQADKLLRTIRESEGKPRIEAAHALKGAAHGVGAFAVANIAERVEQGDVGAIDPLEGCLARVREAAAALSAKD